MTQAQVNIFSVSLVIVVIALSKVLGAHHPATLVVSVAGLAVLLKLAWDRRRPAVHLRPADLDDDQADPKRAAK